MKPVYQDFMIDTMMKLLAVDSPTGMTDAAVDTATEMIREIGYDPVRTEKGGLVVDLGGSGDAIMLSAHLDTLGAMVAEIKPNGRLRVLPLGGLRVENTEAENVRVYTRDGRVYTGTYQLYNPSIHVNLSYDTEQHTFDNMEVVLDEFTSSREETAALGLENGEFVCFDPRPTVTERGYLKSRFLDDKLCVAILIAHAKDLRDRGVVPARRTYLHFTVYEEVGHGGAGSVPADVTEFLALDMGCVGEGLRCTERNVSICAKDKHGPYSKRMVDGLVAAARRAGLDYVVDVYPRYGSDADVALKAGYDIRHGLIGPGVYASHGYERSHVDGMNQTFDLVKAYIGERAA